MTHLCNQPRTIKKFHRQGANLAGTPMVRQCEASTALQECNLFRMITRNSETEKAAASGKPQSNPTPSAAVELICKLEILMMLRRDKKEARECVKQCRKKSGHTKRQHENGVSAVEPSGENPFRTFYTVRGIGNPEIADLFGKGVSIHGTPEKYT